MRDLEQCFKGLADQNRLRILNLLMHGELCVCDIQHVLDASQPNVSRHLIYLKNSGLVLDRREGARIYYRLAPATDSVRKTLFTCLRDLFKSSGALTQDVKKLKKAIEGGACTVSDWRPYSALSKSAASPRI